jgi:hypothetical protein
MPRTEPRRSMTVGALIRALDEYDDRAEVKIWLPGSVIYLATPSGGSPVMGRVKKEQPDVVFIEGNVEPGSALDG